VSRAELPGQEVAVEKPAPGFGHNGVPSLLSLGQRAFSRFDLFDVHPGWAPDEKISFENDPVSNVDPDVVGEHLLADQPGTRQRVLLGEISVPLAKAWVEFGELRKGPVHGVEAAADQLDGELIGTTRDVGQAFGYTGELATVVVELCFDLLALRVIGLGVRKEFFARRDTRGESIPALRDLTQNLMF
jgi:hypothetical protein